MNYVSLEKRIVLCELQINVHKKWTFWEKEEIDGGGEGEEKEREEERKEDEGERREVKGERKSGGEKEREKRWEGREGRERGRNVIHDRMSRFG